jgi:hypothetical protein
LDDGKHVNASKARSKYTERENKHTASTTHVPLLSQFNAC